MKPIYLNIMERAYMLTKSIETIPDRKKVEAYACKERFPVIQFFIHLANKLDVFRLR